MKRTVVILVVVLLVLALAIPVINLVVPVPVPDQFRSIPTTSPAMAQVKEIFATKCAMCHMENPGLPFYARLPVASTLIERDVRKGTAIWNAAELLQKGGRDVVGLAKLEQSVELGTMPIFQYLLLHWNARLTAQERAAILAWVQEVRTQSLFRGLAATQWATFPVQPLPARWVTPLDERKVELGRRLYHDKRLSTDDTISCASCHELSKGGTDQRRFSLGVRNQEGDINAPTVFNAVFNIAQFWDGRAKDLADQAGGPPLNPIEMASSWPEIIGKLSRDAELTALYREVYGVETWEPLKIQDAIAEFEKTLITPDSPVDRYLKGDSTALTEQEARGVRLFKEHSCATCHTGESMGGQSFEKPHDPAAFYASLGRAPHKPDYGRFNVTSNESDRFKMKVPNLRNLARTFPYLHDGSQTNLKDVVRLMHDHFVPPLNRRRLSDADAEAIAAMLLKNTGTLNGQPL